LALSVPQEGGRESFEVVRARAHVNNTVNVNVNTNGRNVITTKDRENRSAEDEESQFLLYRTGVILCLEAGVGM
jgi:hypothetical protein